MNSLIDGALSRSRATIVALFLILVIGAAAYRSVPVEDSPDVRIPIIYVSMSSQGISPEDAERLLVRPMETELKSIEGIKEMKSYASQGHASVVLEFQAGFDASAALQDVREKVDMAKPELPAEAEEPTVNEVNLSLFPVVSIILTSNLPERAFLQLAKKLRDDIEKIPAVLEGEIAGEREETVDIIIEPRIVEQYRLTTDIIAQVRGNNMLVAAGYQDNGKGSFQVEVPGLLETVKDVMRLPILSSNGATVTLEDISTVQRGFKDADGFAKVNGQPALVIEVSKRTGMNIIETIEDVKAVVHKAAALWPDGVNYVFAQDKSADIVEMVSNLENNIFLAIILVMLVIIWFVGIRAGLLVSAAIPGAFLIGIMTIAFMQLTLNIVVLFSLILSIGMLVDNAIVVIEYANRRMMAGESHKTAYATAAKRMAGPLIASTITTLMVFAPLLFWPGIIGQFMQYMPLTLIATLTGSLLMALIFLPVLGTLFGKPARNIEAQKKRILIAESGDLSQLWGATASYLKVLGNVLKAPWLFAVSIVVLLFLTIASFASYGPGVEFFPNVEPQNIQLQVRARGNLSVYEKDDLLTQVTQKVTPLADEVKVFYARSGRFNKGGQDVAEDVVGVLQMELVNWRFRRSAHEILEDMRVRANTIPGIIVETREEEMGPPTGRPINIEISSLYPETLEPVAKNIIQRMQEAGTFVDINDTLPIPEIKWEMDVEREKAAVYGLDMQRIGNYVKLATNGLIASAYRPDDADDEVDIVLRYPEKYRNLESLKELRAVTSKGSVPISHFLEMNAQPTIQTIQRVDGIRIIRITADVKEGVLADNMVKFMQDEISKAYESGEIPSIVNVDFKGEQEDQAETSQFLGNAFILALAAMFLLLVWQFNSFFYAFIIMSAVFLSTAGVLLGLIVTWQPFGIVMCGVGVIALGGIVVNNNIIFIDTFIQLKNEGMDGVEAIYRTAAQRLRPILLTAFTTVLGLMPMVFSLNLDFFTREVTVGAPSSQWWNQLSTSIAGGLTFATLLTLFFTPCLLLIGERFAAKKDAK